jgi:transcriptional regulator with GAF, ATPase, and Fis domain
MARSVFAFENVQHLLLDMARRKTVDAILDLAVKTLHVFPDVALARVWLIQSSSGGDCDVCKFTAKCEDKSLCLRLLASAGQSIVDGATWTHLDGTHSRFPIGKGKVGVIAQEGVPSEVLVVDPNDSWVSDPEWMKREQISSFVGQPLICQDELLGVMAVFTRVRLEEGALEMLRMVADHLAYAIANTRAFETIARLKQQVETENAFLREEIKDAHDFKGIIGESSDIGQILSSIAMVAPTDANVLIYGESGTGKELIAREIHNRSARRNKPMIKVNCSAIPRELFESEFFGHARGAFTGAVQARIGYFQAAEGGTLFLDEVGELPVHLQSKLLRVIQEGEYRRVGEDLVRTADVRIISATNSDLRVAIKSGSFREDLYYRLQVFPIEVLPLRERKSDIRLLANHFLKLYARKFNRPLIRLAEPHFEILTRHDWPGNIRELQNILERLVITSQPDQVLREMQRSAPPVVIAPPAAARVPVVQKPLSKDELRKLEIENMQDALKQTNWKIYGPRGAAEMLAVKPTTLISRMKKLGIYKPPQ